MNVISCGSSGRGRFCLALLVVIGLTFLEGRSAAASGFGMFAECIRAHGAVLYDAHWCANCEEQRRLFRGFANRLKVVQCYHPDDPDTIRRVCKDAGVNSFPTWTFADGTRRTGFLPAAELARITGCSSP